MEKNFTTLNIETLKQGFDEKKVNKSSNTILLIIATLTAAVLAVMLMILIQKKVNSNNLNSNPTENNVVISPTIIQSPTITSIILKPTERHSTPSGTIFPTQRAIISPTENIASPPSDLNL